MIPDYKKGSLVMWCPEDPEPEETIAVLLGLYDAETGEELSSIYDASNVVVNGEIYLPGGLVKEVCLHELVPFDEFANAANAAGNSKHYNKIQNKDKMYNIEEEYKGYPLGADKITLSYNVTKASSK